MKLVKQVADRSLYPQAKRMLIIYYLDLSENRVLNVSANVYSVRVVN